jgi:hypothetical protein
VLLALSLALAGCNQTNAGGHRRDSAPNPASIGFIDIPADQQAVDAPVRVSGWAVDESGVSAVKIYFDDELMATAPIVTARPDVEKQYRRFASPGALHGFEAVIYPRAHTGYTVIRAVAVDGKGGQTEIYHVTVNIR